MPASPVKRLFCFIGLPCSGKSHAAQAIASRIGATHISTGDIARKLMKTEEERLKTASQDQFPDESALRSSLTRLIEAAPVGPVIVDGFPRFPEQAQFMVDEYHLFHPEVIEINVGDHRTLYTRAHFRARDAQDGPAQFALRLNAASANLTGIYTVLQSRFVPYYTIMSTSDDVMLTQFKKLTKIK